MITDPYREVRLAYARISTRTQEIQSQVDALEASGVHRLFQEQISTRVRERPEMKAALAAAREYRSLGAKVTLVVHEMKRLGRGALEHLSLREIASRLVIRTGKKRGQHPAPATVMRMLREHDEQTATAPQEPTA